MPKAERLPFIESANLEPDHLMLLDWLQDWESSTAETEWRKTAPEDYKFYAGDQDTTEVKQLLADQKRPTTTFNVVKPKVDMLVGLAAQTRFQPSVMPVGQEDEALAEIAKGALYHYSRKVKLVRKEVECFEHTTKSGRSLLYFYINNENPFKPEIKVKRLPGAEFILDPQSIEYDMSDARAIFIDKWMTEEDIKAHWPGVDTAQIKDRGAMDGYPDFFNEEDDKYRVVECWYRKYVKVRWFINPLTGKEEGLEIEDFKKFAKVLEEGIPQEDGSRSEPIPVPQYVDTQVRKVFYMLFTDVFKIEGGPSPYRWKGFPCVLFGAYKNDNTNTWFSAITMMKDPQVALNTMRRQLSHLLQTLPKGLLKHEVGAIMNMEEYEKRAADPSFHLEIAKGMFDKVDFVTQPAISPIYQQYDASMGQAIKDTSGAQDDLMGIQQTSREPGITVQARQQTGLAVLYIIFDNFRESRLDAGRIMLSFIQQYVTSAEVIRIQGQAGQQMIQLNTQLNPQSPDFNDISVGEYDLEVEETVENATMRMAVAQTLTEFAQNNPGAIPPDIILDYMDMPFTVKQRVQEAWKAQQEAQQSNIDADRAMEMMKLKMDMQKSEREHELEMERIEAEDRMAEKEAKREDEKADKELELKKVEVKQKLKLNDETHRQKIKQSEEKHKIQTKQSEEKGKQQLDLNKKKTVASIETARQKAKQTKEKSNGSNAGSKSGRN